MNYSQRVEMFRQVKTAHAAFLTSVLWKLTGDRELFTEALQYALLRDCFCKLRIDNTTKRFNGERERKSAQSYFALRFLRKAKPPKPSSKSVDGSGTA